MWASATCQSSRAVLRGASLNSARLQAEWWWASLNVLMHEPQLRSFVLQTAACRVEWWQVPQSCQCTICGCSCLCKRRPAACRMWQWQALLVCWCMSCSRPGMRTGSRQWQQVAWVPTQTQGVVALLVDHASPISRADLRAQQLGLAARHMRR